MKAALSFFFLILFSALALAADPVAYENQPKFEELYRIKIWNMVGGTIEVSSDEGKSWQQEGSVILPVGSTNPDSYKASRWVEDGKVAATSVNAIHIKTGVASADGSGIIFSILPKEFAKKPKG